MKKIGSLFTDSMREFRYVRTLTVCGLLAALAFVLESFSIPLGETLKIGFSGLPNEMVDFLFGPAVGSLFSGMLDVLKYIVHPTGGFFPGFTFNAFLAGLIYGVFLYKKPVSFWRILTAKFVVALLVNVFLNTYWLSILYGNAFSVLLPARLMKNLLMWPINSFVTYLLLKVLERSGVVKMIKNVGKRGVAGI